MKSVNNYSNQIASISAPPTLTFESMPQAIGEILNRLVYLEQLVQTKHSVGSIKPPISTKELCKFLNISEPTAIRLRHKRIIPYYTIGTAVRYDIDKVIQALEKKKK